MNSSVEHVGSWKFQQQERLDVSHSPTPRGRAGQRRADASPIKGRKGPYCVPYQQQGVHRLGDSGDSGDSDLRDGILCKGQIVHQHVQTFILFVEELSDPPMWKDKTLLIFTIIL